MMAPVITKHPSSDSEGEHETRRKKKRSSRWGTEDPCQKTAIPGMPTIIPSNMTKEQEKAYLTQLRIEEITRMLRTGELGIPPNIEDRSPSPEPQYDSMGKRLNTREVRTRRKLEDERHKLIVEMLKLNPEYKPPADYKPPSNKICDKVFIPQDDHPEINFVGLLIGPRGNTLKNLEKETNAKIIIRGKGSIKEGKIGRKDGQPLPGEDEQLHAFITGATIEIVQHACQKVRDIVQQGIEVPECMNDLRKNQLRELALLNGTLRENDTLNKLKLITQAQTIVTNTIICALCGGAGHITSDCKIKTSGTDAAGERVPTWAEREKMDTEYQSLMAELGQGHAPDPSRMREGKCIISRNGSGADFGSRAIESAPPVGSGNASPAVTNSNANESSQSPSTYSNRDADSPAPPPPPSTSSLVLNAAGVVEKVIDGRKVIDFTDVPRPGRGGIPPRERRRDRNEEPQYTYALNTPSTAYELETAASQSMANAAMMYSQQMNYYYGMPMWPGMPGAAAGYPAWPGQQVAAPPPPPPPDNQPPPPPPPPPK